MHIYCFLPVLVISVFAEDAFIAKPGDDFLQGGIVQQGRIIGGVDAVIQDFPWQVSLRTSAGSHTCGAVILTPTWLLTAAHCTQGSGYTIRAGSNEHSGGVVIPVKTIINHERYNMDTWTISNDISLIELSSPLTFSASIQPIALPSAGQNFDNVVCTITGWGRTCGRCSIATWLQKLSIRVITNSECTNRMQGVSGVFMHPSHICVYDDADIGACNGDSGGPMSCTVQGQTYLAGITSWVISSQSQGCLTSYPSVYTRVTEFLPWITSKVPLL